MSERSELLREADEAYAALRQAMEGLSEEEMQDIWLGTWGVREIAIHIAGWHREMIPALARIGRGEPPYPDGVGYDDGDAWNARFVASRQGVKAADALVELDASHRAYVAAAVNRDEPRFAGGLSYAWAGLGNPVLGQTWRARIYAPGVGSSTLLVGYDLPLDGISTTRGELLVKTPPYGGTKLFSSTAFSNGTFALHELALPLEPALYGLPVSFQALIVDGPSGNQYCNALDVILSPYE